jgi:hypothetical protein
MDMWGVLPVNDRRFKEAVKDMTQLSREPLQLGMASCHSLTLINGELSGDPLDVKVRSKAHIASCMRLKLDDWLFLLTGANRVLGEHQVIR